MARILVLNGVNLNLLGTREPEIYGPMKLSEMMDNLREQAQGHEVVDIQSNYEGCLVEAIQEAKKDGYDYIILNAGAWTHYSIAIRDAISAVDVPVIEVHLSNIQKRENFRHNSVLSAVVEGQIAGFGLYSYKMALFYIIEKLAQNKIGL